MLWCKPLFVPSASFRHIFKIVLGTRLLYWIRFNNFESRLILQLCVNFPEAVTRKKRCYCLCDLYGSRDLGFVGFCQRWKHLLWYACPWWTDVPKITLGVNLGQVFISDWKSHNLLEEWCLYWFWLRKSAWPSVSIHAIKI